MASRSRFSAFNWGIGLSLALASLLLPRTALGVEPLQPQVARCWPEAWADATQGRGNTATGRSVRLDYRWALSDASDVDSEATAIGLTTRVEVCWTSASENGVARCPGQTGNNDWIIYSQSSPSVGSPPAAEVVANPATNMPGDPPASIYLPLDWDSIADREKILFVVVNLEVQDGTYLTLAPRDALTLGGFCGTPSRLEPGIPGTIAFNERFIVYGVDTSFALPNGWGTHYPALCSKDSVTICPDPKKGCGLSGHGTLGPCVRMPAVSFWRANLREIDEWQWNWAQGGILPTAQRLWNWHNGTGVSGSTCAVGQTCPTRSLWVPWKSAGTGGNGINITHSSTFEASQVVPLSKHTGSFRDGSSYPLRTLAHEYWHNLQVKWVDQSGNELPKHPQFIEPTAEVAVLATCLENYPSNPNGASVPANKCVSARTLYYDQYESSGSDNLLQVPHDPLKSYPGMWFYRYAAEQSRFRVY